MRSLLILLSCLVASCGTLVSATAPILSLSQRTVLTDRGLVSGVQVENGVEFRGIPYAAAPVGSLRFAAPRSAPRWSGVRDATTLTSACTQTHTAPDGTMSIVGSEDCLTLSVFTPRNSDNCPSSKLPVHVYLHGGAFIAGNGHGDVTSAGVGNGVYNGSSLAQNNGCSVQVFPNYRLGAFGFLAVSDASPIDGVGNFGILDQIAALKWVQRNIGFFGGDASRVTVSGESAGAFSVCTHLASPKSAGLFDGAILMSTTCDSTVFYTPLDKSVAWANSFAKAVGCESHKNSDLMKCLRALPASTLMTPDYANNFPVYRPLMWPIAPWSVTIDGKLLTKTPLAMFEDGDVNSVSSVILGTVADEATFFTRQFMSTIVNFQGGAYNYADVDSLMPHFFGRNATSLDLVHATYPAEQFAADSTKRTDAVFRDFLFLCPTQRAALALADHNIPTYLYQIEHINSNDFLTQPANQFNPYGSYGAYHSSELALLFNTNINFAFSDDDKLFSSTLANYWSKMFASYNPNANLHRPFAADTSPAFPFWPRFERDTLSFMRLNSVSAVGTALQETQCETWQRIAQHSP